MLSAGDISTWFRSLWPSSSSSAQMEKANPSIPLRGIMLKSGLDQGSAKQIELYRPEPTDRVIQADDRMEYRDLINGKVDQYSRVQPHSSWAAGQCAFADNPHLREVLSYQGSLRLISPLQADKESRENYYPDHYKAPRDVTETRQLTVIPMTPERDSYQVVFKTPNDLLSQEQINQLLIIIKTVNQFIAEPIRVFRWDILRGGEFRSTDFNSGEKDVVHIGQETPTGIRIPHFDFTKSILVHEMGHGIFYKGICKPADGDMDNYNVWNVIYGLSLEEKNYEIIDESNYIPGTMEKTGTPYENNSEAFASAVHSFVSYADQFATYIQNPNTPEKMRRFGKLVWCYMRERIFANQVFTSDCQDPFASDKFESLFRSTRCNRVAAILKGIEDPDPETQRHAKGALALASSQRRTATSDTEEYLEEEDVPQLLSILNHSNSSDVRQKLIFLFGNARERRAFPKLLTILIEKTADLKERREALGALKSMSGPVLENVEILQFRAALQSIQEDPTEDAFLRKVAKDYINRIDKKLMTPAKIGLENLLLITPEIKPGWNLVDTESENSGATRLMY